MRELSIALAWLGLACTAVQVTIQADPETDFSRFATYAQLPPPTESPAAPRYTPALGERIQREIATTLEAKGYRAASAEQADIRVAFHVSNESRERIVNAGDPDVDYSVEQAYVEGTLEIDVIEAESGRRVWRGRGQTKILTSGSLIPEHVDSATLAEVRAILAKLPAAGAGSGSILSDPVPGKRKV